jgi:hypothetical protein
MARIVLMALHWAIKRPININFTALSAGFPLVLGIVAFLYAVVGVIFPVNEIADSTGDAA